MRSRLLEPLFACNIGRAVTRDSYGNVAEQSMNMRWALKRAAKWAVELGMTASGGGIIYRRSAAFRKGYRILTYHGIADEPQDSYSVQTDHFRFHMAFLADHYRVVRLQDVARALKTGAAISPETIVVTFDDGYKECATVAGEILDALRIPVTFYIVTGILDGMIRVANRNYMSWDDVKTLAKAGFSIGSHTVSHRSLGGLPLDEVERELIVSKGRIQEEIGTPPAGLTYPYGTMRDFSPDIVSATERAGYMYAATAIHGLNHKGVNPFMLRRTSLTAGDGPRTFRMILNGCLDPWRLVDVWAFRFQRPTADGLS
jgi:peptidoglycan/xylan/chitin deacetylase (PgdA/CDA1 family)